MDDHHRDVLPQSPIGKAFGHTISLWDSLMNYLCNGALLIDINLIENTIRANALGRIAVKKSINARTLPAKPQHPKTGLNHFPEMGEKIAGILTHRIIKTKMS